MSKRKDLIRFFLFLAAYTAAYGAIRFVKQDEWQWEVLILSYAAMASGYFFLGPLFRKRPDHG